MTEPTLWKITEIIAKLSDRQDLIEENLKSYSNVFEAYGEWSKTVNDTLTKLAGELEYLKNKKAPA